MIGYIWCKRMGTRSSFTSWYLPRPVNDRWYLIYLFFHVVLPVMRRARKGYVINLSSTSGLRGLPAMEFYTGSKFALEGIMDSMRYSLAPFNIAVTNINAGPVRTNITNSLGTTGISEGRAFRQIEDRTQYLTFLTQSMLEGLNRF